MPEELLIRKAPLYHPRDIKTKTANHTLTISDDEVQFNCTSGELTATLPTLSSLRSGLKKNKSFKIKKTDSSTNRLIIAVSTDTPANYIGTNGTDTQRVIHAENDYIIVTPNHQANNWDISYESQMITFDRSAGTATIKPTLT